MVVVQHIRRLAASEGLKSSVIMVFGNVFAQGMSGVAIIIFSRLIGPEEFGIFSTGFALAMIVVSLIDFGLTAAQQQAIPRAETAVSRNTIFGTVLALKLTLFALVVLLTAVLAPWISDRLHFSSASLIFWIVITSFGSVFFNQLVGMLLAIKRVAQTVVINSTQAVTKLLLALVIFISSWTSGAGILLVYLALPLITVPFAKLLLPQWYRFAIRFDRPSWLVMQSMALNNWIASFGSVLIQNADIVLVSLLLSQSEAGLIGAASRLALFIAVIGSSLASVLIPRVSTYRLQSDLDAFWRKATMLFAGSVGLAVLSFFISGPLIAFTVGGEYLSAAPMLAWLLAASWLAVGITPINSLFYSYDKAWFFSVSAVLQAGLLLLGNVVLLPVYGIIAAGWVRLLAQALVVGFGIVVALLSHRQRFQQLPRLR